MNKIKILDESISNIIAAGEVVENPASMIKELIENSLDANSSSIKINVTNKGRNVKIIDNGNGMSKTDLFLSIERHATSKIISKEDIYNLKSYGFRGEALASIASVSKMSIASKNIDSITGHQIYVNAGKIIKDKEVVKNQGTEIEIKELFFNTPARLKFLRTKNTEYNKIKHVVLTQALANYNVSFQLSLDNKIVLKTSGKGFENCITELFSFNILKNLKKFKYGYYGTMDILRSTKDYIFTYINKRYVKSKIIETAIIDAYYTKLMKGKYPFAIIYFDINPKEIDVNVHPSKKIIKFSNDNTVYNDIKSELKKTLWENESDSMPSLNIENNNIKPTKYFNNEKITTTPTQIFNNFELNKQNYQEIKKIDSIYKIKEEKNSFVENINIQSNNNFQNFNKISQKKVVNDNIMEYKINRLKNIKILGQLNNMYILVERNETLEIYDQHIVHERILYEELKEKYYNKKISKQNLLTPISIEVSEIEKEKVIQNLDIFNDFGFEIEDFGENEIIIRTVPTFNFRKSVKETFFNIIKEMMSKKETDIRENIIISMSCKNAIKAGEKLEIEEISILLNKLYLYGKFTCPHGRPIILKIPFLELDKKFGRK
ncbi:DNA mismatch repair protein MutL [Hypnocyclicus thermotrophus]|uniref:DNA mismatch repair protein MutL n=1 Tax=Hypnocyclicus thermotrophus TaxID=1627895 RepID=A0AA46DZW5_9FUSO|nr:DNA mismatch repair endonuclease MutL [Hypnocyclicus thermotrophus]TDT71928.1 DNA mismatch repair protein MutL [Hypnocyclicus thermotrophus]